MSGQSTLLVSLLALSTLVRADYFSTDPLVGKVVPYDQIPYQVMTDTDDPRGFQSGYNICNSTTENQDSKCQTMFVNHIDDFCLWAPATPNTTISDAEGDVVAWCNKKGHGTRIIPDGAITGLQMIYTPSYIQIAGTLNQLMLDIGGTDGGELDSGGQDGEGNPMGGLVYTNAFASNNGNNGSYQQAQHWSFFIGNGGFCGKICDQSKGDSTAQALCNNVYDRLGCDYNAPNTAAEGTFEVCQGDDMTPVGEYVVNGVTSTYHQPAETDPVTDVPYTATPAPTSSCVTYASAAVFTDAAGITAAGGSASASGAAPSGSAGAATGAKTTGGSGAKTGSATGSSPSSSATGSSGAPAAMGVSLGAVVLGVVAVFASL